MTNLRIYSTLGASSSISRPLQIALRTCLSQISIPLMRSSINFSLCFHLNPELLLYFSRASWATSCSISGMLHPNTLQSNTRLYKIPHISSKISETPHPATTLLKLPTNFMINLTTKTRQYGNFFLSITTPLLTLHKRNSLLIPLPPPLARMLFPGPWKAYVSHPLLLASWLKKVPVRRPKTFLIPMAGFIPPQPGS